MQNRSKSFSLFILIIAFVAFVYIVAKAAMIVDKRQIGTGEGIYTNCVSSSPYIKQKAKALIAGCESELCEVQRLLDYVTVIPYQVNNFKAYKPKQTIENNYGDCDDKSNLLISLLYSIGEEAYFVLVPEHIFVIVSLEDKRLEDIKGIWIDGKKYYILESTAEKSKVGFPLRYKLNEIETVLDPFSNEKLRYQKLEYR